MVKNSFIEKTYVVGTHRKMNTHAKIRYDKTSIYTFKMPLLPGDKYSVELLLYQKAQSNQSLHKPARLHLAKLLYAYAVGDVDATKVQGKRFQA